MTCLLGLALTLGVSRASAGQDVPTPGAGPDTAPATCPATTEAENIAIARAWHEEVINRRNPAALQDILAPQVVHHAAGGYPSVMNAAGVAGMMDDFLRAFSNLRYNFDFFVVQDDHVVERYTATGTQTGPFQNFPPGRTATWTGINIFRIECGRIAEVWSEVDAVSRSQQLSGTPTATPAR
jgi:predicted ester cyclase